MKIKIALPRQSKIQLTSPSYDTSLSSLKKTKTQNTFSNKARDLGYNLTFFDMSKARKFFNKNPSFSNDQRNKILGQISKKNVLSKQNIKSNSISKSNVSSECNIFTKKNQNMNKQNSKLFTPTTKKENEDKKFIKTKKNKKKIEICTESPIYKKYNHYKAIPKDNIPITTMNNTLTGTNRIQKINIYKATNYTVGSMTKVNTPKGDTSKNIFKNIRNEKENNYTPSLTQDKFYPKKNRNQKDDIITADLISEQERKKVIMFNHNTTGNANNPPLPGKITKIETQRYQTKNLILDKEQIHILRKPNSKSKSSIYKKSKPHPNGNINTIKTENHNKGDSENNSLNSAAISPNNLNRTGTQILSRFKNRYKNLIENYILSNTEIDNIYE